VLKWSDEGTSSLLVSKYRNLKYLRALGQLSLSNNLKYDTNSFMVVYNCCCYDVMMMMIIIIIKVSISVYGDLVTEC
jgi:hypothetical protein